jgi:arylsulfatase A-like enzyme
VNRPVCAIALALGLSVGFLDAALGVWPASPEQSAFWFLASLAVTFLVLVSAYLAGWVLVVGPLGRRGRLAPVPLAAAFAALSGQVFLLALISDLIHFHLPWPDVFKLLLLLLVSLLTSVAVYLALENPRLAARLETGLPVLPLAVLGAAVILSPPVAWLMGRGKTPLATESARVSGGVKHVILITVDALRADAVSAYAPQAPPTPNMDGLAREGILFRRAYAVAPWTLPSLSSVLSGLSPQVHQATNLFRRLPDSVNTLAERLRDSGYLTAAEVSNPFFHPAYNLEQGFSHYEFFPRSPGHSFGARVLFRLLRSRFEPSTEDLTRRAIDWIASNREKNFFLWIHYLDPHEPYTPPAEFLPSGQGPAGSAPVILSEAGPGIVPPRGERRWIRERYRGEVRYVDRSIGELLSGLKAAGVYDEALIILTADHGEEFWEHGGTSHGYTLYDEVLHVPLVIKLPGPTQPVAKETSVLVANADLMPTILDLCRVDYDPERLSYHSLAPLWGTQPEDFPAAPVVSRGLYSRLQEDSESVFFDRLHYIRSYLTGREQLYDLERDPKEQLSLVATAPEALTRARSLLAAASERAKQLRAVYGIQRPEDLQPTKDLLDRLRALGYVQ